VAFFIKDDSVLDIAVYDLGPDARSKQNVWMALATKAALEKCQGVVLINDVFMSKIKPEDLEKDPSLASRAPSQDPNRISCAMITYIAADKNDQMITIPYDRDNRGSFIKEEEIEWGEEQLQGPQGDIFHHAFSLPEPTLRFAGALLDTLIGKRKVDMSSGEVIDAQDKDFFPHNERSEESDGSN